MVSALLTLLSIEHVTYLCFGVFLGLIVGILPGLGGTAGLALLLPFVFNMEATPYNRPQEIRRGHRLVI